MGVFKKSKVNKVTFKIKSAGKSFLINISR